MLWGDQIQSSVIKNRCNHPYRPYLIISKYDKNIPYTLKNQRMFMLLNDVLLYMYVHVICIHTNSHQVNPTFKCLLIVRDTLYEANEKTMYIYWTHYINIEIIVR